MNFAYDITDRTLNLLSYAASFAEALQDYKITPEYLFIGALLNKEADNGMRAVMERYGISENKFYKTLFGTQANALQVRLRKYSAFELPSLLYKLSGLATQIMGKAVHQLKGNRILEPEDLIMAILEEPRSVTCDVLQDMNVDLDLLRNDIAELQAQVHAKSESISQNQAANRPSYDEESNYYNRKRSENARSTSEDKQGDKLMSVADVRKRIPTLLKYGKDLSKMAEEGKLDPVIGRQQELKRMVQILGRRMKNNPLLIGEPGVGKTAVVEALVQAIQKGDVPRDLQKRVVISLDVVSLLAGASYQGEYEERLKKCLQEVSDNKQVIIFIDEIHTLLTGEGNRKDDSRISNVLKPLLARGDIQVIGATTSVEYRKFFSNDAALERRFMPITVNEPSEEDAILIIKGLRNRYEQYHQIKITDEAIQAAVKLSKRYLPARFLPDKAIDLIDEAGSRLKLSAKEMENSVKNIKQSSNTENENEAEQAKDSRQALAQQIEGLKSELQALQDAKQKACDKEDFEEAATCRQKELQKQAELKDLECELQQEAKKAYVLTAQDIAETLTDWTNIPINQLNEEENSRLRNLEAELHKRVIGQDEAVKALAKAIRRGRVGLSLAKKPIGSFLFMGTTGVGKTELAKALAEVLFGDRNNLIRFDMSEYDSQMSATRLFGSAPGYVGFEEGGQLTEAVYKKPYSVVLLDEVEKAHPDIWNVFLQVLEDGRLTDGKGRLIDFSNTVIIMTSNVGANLLTESRSTVGRIGFAQSKETGNDKNGLGIEADYNGHSYEEAKKLVLNELKQRFNPEFLNRLDKIVFFEKLNKPAMREIAKLMLKTLQANSKRIGYSLTYSEAALDELTQKGYDPKYGARPLRRIIDGDLQDLLVDLKLSENAPKSAYFCLDYDDEQGFYLSEITERAYREKQASLQNMSKEKTETTPELLVEAKPKTNKSKQGAKAKQTVEKSEKPAQTAKSSQTDKPEQMGK